MSNKDSNKRFGLIGLSLIIAAYIIWAFILPRSDKPLTDKTIDNITAQPVQEQTTPLRPISEPPMPPRP